MVMDILTISSFVVLIIYKMLCYINSVCDSGILRLKYYLNNNI